MSITLAIIVAVALIFIAMLFYAVSIYNGLVTVKNNVEKNWSNIDVLLKQRFDEIPKLVAVCERYMKHEAETLEKVTKARAAIQNAHGVAEQGQAENFLSQTLKSLFAVSENYPELKADIGFRQLQGRVSELENEISDRRELFNDSVNIYNIRIEQIPDVIVAALLGYKAKELWKINPAERENQPIKFSM
ncbi:MAG: LemA family protein [Deltaproteobacteria bacterium]|nr:LemA family protein [Deltaproteobacteria bacterium]